MEESGRESGEAGTLLEQYQRLEDKVTAEFPELIDDSEVERSPGDAPRNLRIFLVDGSFVDIWISGDRYSFHWQSEEKVVRFDNAPHHKELETYPDHMHIGEEVKETVLEEDFLGDKLASSIEYLVEEGFITF